MAQTEAYSEQPKFPFFNLAPQEFAAFGQKRIEDFVAGQSALLNDLQETNREWLDRIQVEANENTECLSKLTAARSIPDAMTACQEWANRWFEMMSEDRKHLLADYQKLAEAGARLVSKSWASKGNEANA